MIRRLSSTRSAVGLDIGRTTIKAAQVTGDDKGPRLDGVLCLKRTSDADMLDADEAAALVRAMSRRGMTATRIVMVAPTDALVGGSITVPPPDASVPRDQVVAAELSRTYQLAPGTFEYAWWDLPASGSGSRIGQAHAVALPHGAVTSTLEHLESQGLETVRTLPSSLVLLAAAQRKPIDPRRISAVLDMGSRKAHLALMYSGRVVHERDLPDFNITRLRESVAGVLGVGDLVAHHALGHFGVRDEPTGVVACETTALLGDALGPLTEEIGMSFAYVSHLYPEAELGALLLAGGGANVPGLPSAIGGVLELETAVIRPNTLAAGEVFGTECGDPALGAAVGAALTGVVR